MMNDRRRFCMLIILDGWGIGPVNPSNAVSVADTPHLDNLRHQYPHTQLLCSGEAVGLPKGIMGNSEVGHLNIGAGRVVYQDLLRIDQAIADGRIFDNPALTAVMERVAASGSTLHLMGLVSDGGVHSQLAHLLVLLDMARHKGLSKVCVHAILDGRDTPPDSGAGYLEQLQTHINKHRFGQVATVCGRFYAMDRDKRWDRIQEAYQLYTQGAGDPALDPVAAVNAAYQRGVTDEFVRPIVLTDAAGEPNGTIQNSDGIIFFNFRADRAREITRALTDPDFDGFQRNVFPQLNDYVCMTQFDENFTLPVAFPPTHLDKILGEVISRNGLRQLRIAETEKYAHVTYFFNGGEEKPFPLEDRCLIPSPRDVATYDQKPEMSALAVTAEVLERLSAQTYDLIVLNFANMDMVGHTGVLAAAVQACETVDRCIGKIITAVSAQGGAAIITADHGNSEKMVGASGKPFTAHTLNPVPLILVDDSRKDALLREGVLADIAPTILHIMALVQPEEMTGRSLLAT
jgi:2,3-bisphosphoglycerate-independent phosphoglycerate mutase